MYATSGAHTVIGLNPKLILNGRAISSQRCKNSGYYFGHSDIAPTEDLNPIPCHGVGRRKYTYFDTGCITIVELANFERGIGDLDCGGFVACAAFCAFFLFFTSTFMTLP